jgi:hypothetical protein
MPAHARRSALERLHHATGKVFRQYQEAKHDNADVAQIARLRQDYLDAQREAEGLSPRDAAGIRAVLTRPA